jgi:hypothetical protein
MPSTKFRLEGAGDRIIFECQAGSTWIMLESLATARWRQGCTSRKVYLEVWRRPKQGDGHQCKMPIPCQPATQTARRNVQDPASS